MNIVKDINVLLEEFDFQPRRVQSRDQLKYEIDKKKLERYLSTYTKELDPKKYKDESFTLSDSLKIKPKISVNIWTLRSDENIIAVSKFFNGKQNFSLRFFKK